MSAAPAPVTKTMYATFVGGPDSGKSRKECWEARTTDGRWLIERVEEPGTPWHVYQLVGGAAVRFANSFSTLRKARISIASGGCEVIQHFRHLDLPWVTVEAGGITGRYATEAEARAADLAR